MNLNKREYLFYNTNIKEDFLSKYTGNTRDIYARIFSISKSIEEKLNKDLYDFSLQELEILFRECNPLTLTSSKNNGHIASVYMSWAIEKKYRDNQTNPFDNLAKNFYKKFVNKDAELYISESEIENIERDLYNYQDKVIVRLLFEGVTGGNECAELRNLRIDDVDFNKRILTLYTDRNDSNTRRTLKVSQKAINFIEGAIKETKYLKNNGDLSPTTKARYSNMIEDNGFVLRSAKVRNPDEVSPIKIFTIYRRLNMIAEQFGKPYFNANNIARSGMIKLAHDLMGETQELGRKEYDEICKHFNVPKSVSDTNKSDYNYSHIKQFLNTQTVEELYGEKGKKIAL